MSTLPSHIQWLLAADGRERRHERKNHCTGFPLSFRASKVHVKTKKKYENVLIVVISAAVKLDTLSRKKINFPHFYSSPVKQTSNPVLVWFTQIQHDGLSSSCRTLCSNFHPHSLLHRRCSGTTIFSATFVHFSHTSSADTSDEELRFKLK